MIGPYSNTTLYRPYTPTQQPYDSYGFQRPAYTPSTAHNNQQTPLPPQQPEVDHTECKKAIKKTAIYSTAFGAFGIWILNAIFNKK